MESDKHALYHAAMAEQMHGRMARAYPHSESHKDQWDFAKELFDSIRNDVKEHKALALKEKEEVLANQAARSESLEFTRAESSSAHQTSQRGMKDPGWVEDLFGPKKDVATQKSKDQAEYPKSNVESSADFETAAARPRFAALDQHGDDTDKDVDTSAPEQDLKIGESATLLKSGSPHSGSSHHNPPADTYAFHATAAAAFPESAPHAITPKR